MVEQLNHFARVWWDWSAAMFWQVGLLILLIASVDRLIRRWAWPQLRYTLWSLILIKLILPPSLSLPSGVIPELRPVVRQAFQRLDAGRPEAEQIADCGLQIADLSRSAYLFSEPVYRYPSGPGETDLEVGMAEVPHGANPQSEIANPQFEWPVYAMAAWLSGTSILGIWLVIRLHSLRGRRAYTAAAASLPRSFYNQMADCASRLRLRHVPRVVVTRRLSSPAVFGIIRPVLLMPKGYLSKLSRRDTEHMLLHELAHIKRGDLVMHSLYMLLQVVYWYNPLLWLVRRQVHHLRELSCDATVAELLRERTTAYRQTLLETARRLLATSAEPGLGLLGLFEDSNRLLVRLNWLTKPTWRYRTMKRVTVVTIAVLMFACVLPMAQAREAVSHREEPVVREQDVELSRQIADMEVRLQQLRAEQEQLLNDLRALSERRRQPAGGGGPRRERAVEDIDVMVEPREAPARAGGGGRPASGEEMDRIRVEAAARAAREAARAAAEGRRAEVQRQDAWARQWGDQLRQWEQSEQMQQWRRDVEQWQKQMQEWAKAQAQRSSGVTDRTQSQESTEPPAMPPMPAMPHLPAPMDAPARRQRQGTDGTMGSGPIPHVPHAAAPVHVPVSPREGANIKVQTPAPKQPPARVPALPAVTVPHEQLQHMEAEMRKLQEHTKMLEEQRRQIMEQQRELHRRAGELPTRQHDENRAEATSVQEIAESLSADQALEIVNEFGSITVRRGDDDVVRIVAKVKGRAATADEARAVVDRAKLDIRRSPEKLSVAMTKPEATQRQENVERQVDLEVIVPRHARIKLSQSFGDIRLNDLSGSVKAATNMGSIRAVGVSGQVALAANFGEIDFIGPRDLSARIQANAQFGSIRSDLPLEIVKPDQFAMGSRASGVIGGGDGNVSLATNMGSIHIRTQAAEPDETF